MRRFGLLLTLLMAAAVPARAQVTGTRFEIKAVGDSTISFERGAARWVRPGQVGIVVDPRQRDALIGRFRVVAVDSNLATGLITGQTTRMGTDYWVILHEPPPRFSRRLLFLGGLILGFAAGVISGIGP